MKILAMMTFDVLCLSLGWALESMGHQVYHLNRIKKHLVEEAIIQFKPDLFFTVGWDNEHGGKKLSILREILKKNGVFHLYFAEEDHLHFPNWSKPYVEHTQPEFVLTRSKHCIPKYQEMGFQAVFLDVGSVPELHRPMAPDLRYICDVSVMARPHFWYDSFRHKSIADLVIPLFDQSFHTRIWGADWVHVEKYYGKTPRKEMLQGILPFRETPRVYNSTKVNLSVQTVEDQISNRTYDILMSGGFVLTSDTPGVREHLQPGIHCDVSNSPEETVEKISFYLKHEEIRQRIAQKGRELASEKFVYKKTIPDVWPDIEKAVLAFQAKKMRSGRGKDR